jgi:hypothetical protein
VDKQSSEKAEQTDAPSEKPFVKLPGTVEKVIAAVHPSESDKAQISVEGADPLYREIRVPNTLHDRDGKTVAVKKGAEVEVTIEADPKATVPKVINNTGTSAERDTSKDGNKWQE